MKHYCLTNLLALILLLVTPFSFAMSQLADGEVMITLRDNQPCFSFPVDEERENRHYFLYNVDVSFHNYVASDSSIESWTLRIERREDNPISHADTPEYCIEYGKSVPFGKSSVTRPIEMNIPYAVSLTIYTREKSLTSINSSRTYHSDFCLILDKKNKKTIVSVEYNSATGKLECKP